MALPDEPTAAELAEFLGSSSSNDDLSREKLSFKRRWYNGMEAWTGIEIRAVADAAQRSASVRELTVDVADLSDKVADDIKQIISQLRRVRKIWIRDSLHPRAATPMAHPDFVDAVLRGIMASESSITHLQLYGCCSSRTIRQFIKRFPNLETLDIEGLRPNASGASGDGDAAFGDFTVALALDMGKLTSLRDLLLDSNAGNVAFLTLLSAVESSTTVDTIALSVSNRSGCLLPSGFRFFATRCPGTVRSAHIRANTNGELLDISTFFPVGGGHAAFSPSMNNVQFTRCEAGVDDPFWFDRAGAALTHVNTLGFFQCRLSPWGLEHLLVKLTHLTDFYCLSRKRDYLSTDTLDDEFDDAPFVLGTNDALTKFCEVIERPDSLLKNVDLDIVSSEDAVHFPAIVSLLKHSKGELIANFGQLPRLSSDHVDEGCKGLSNRLNVLRIRFCRCKFGDGKFASFLRALGSTKSLKVLEFGFDAHANLGTPEMSIAETEGIINDNKALEELALRGLGSDAVVTLMERILPSLATKNRSLRKLDFFGADLADVWPRIRAPFLAVLHVNGVLFQLGGDLRIPKDDLRVPDDDRKVRKWLKENQYGRQFCLPRDAPVPTGLWATIFAKIAENGEHDVMSAFLRKKLVSLLHPSLDPSGVGHPKGGADSESKPVG
jgi:hypothetical protein